MSWKIERFEDIGGNKALEFHKFLNLPLLVSTPLELAVAAPGGFDVASYLQPYGWRCRNAFSVSHNLTAYRDYLRSSLGEFSVAKHTYVKTNSSWFSDRTGCYLMSGRPAVVQDTGFSTHLPTGEGLLAFRTIDEARAGLDAIATNYARHSRAARDLAMAHFAP